MNEPIDDAWTFFRELQQHGSATVTNRLRDELEEMYGPPGWMRDAFGRWLKTFETHDEPPPALRAAPERHDTGFSAAAVNGQGGVVARMAGPTAEERAGALVPLVRQAAAEVPVGSVSRLDPELARLRVYWPEGKPLPQPALADWANKPVTWPRIVGWYRDQEQRQHDADCGCLAHSWWLP